MVRKENNELGYRDTESVGSFLQFNKDGCEKMVHFVHKIVFLDVGGVAHTPISTNKVSQTFLEILYKSIGKDKMHNRDVVNGTRGI